MPEAHSHDDIELNIADAAITYLFAGQLVEIPAGRLTMLWGSLPHQLISPRDGTRITWVTLPLAAFLGWSIPGGAMARLLGGEVLSIEPDPLEPDPLPRLQRWARDLAGDEFVRGCATIEMQAFTQRIAAADRAGDAPETRQARPGRGRLEAVAVMAQFVAQHRREPITVADIAGAAHLNPRYAMTVFAQTMGVTINTYLTRSRLAESQRLLVQSDAAVSTIAFDVGFASLSQFHDRFKRETGTTPAAYRRTRTRG